MDVKTVERLLVNSNRGELLEIISKLTKTCKDAEGVLLDYCKKNNTTDNSALLVKNQLLKHWKVAGTIISDANMYGGCSGEDEEDAYESLEAMIELVEENDVAWEIRKKLLDEMLAEVAYDNSIFTDYLVDVSIIFCITDEEKRYLAGFLAEKGNSYYRDYAGRIYLGLGDDMKYLETKMRNLRYGSDFLELAKYYMKKNKPDLAMETATKGLSADGRMDELYTFLFKRYKKQGDMEALNGLYELAIQKKRNIDTITELMYEHYKESSNYNMQKEMLIKMVSCCNSNETIKWFNRCQEELTESDWAENETNLLKALKQSNLGDYFELCLSKGNTEEVFNHLKEKKSYWSFSDIDANHRFSKRLATTYPKDIVAMYKREVAYFVRLGKEKNYRHAVSVLREIRSIMKKNKWADEWNSYLYKFKEEHKRKRLLLAAMGDMK